MAGAALFHAQEAPKTHQAAQQNCAKTAKNEIDFRSDLP
jgi:hypothetical protein